jgi:HK97 family phage major capsid protein
MTLREMIVKKNALADEARALIAENKVTEAEAKKTEVENLNKSIELLVAVEDEANKNVLENKEEKVAAPIKNKKPEYSVDVFMNIFQNTIAPDKYPLTEESRAMKNAFAEDPSIVATQDAAPNGASIALPKDVQNQIIEVRKSFPNLENLVTVERVGYTSGSRIVELNSALAPFPSVDEGNVFPDAPKPEFKKVEYAVKKYGDILKFTYEMTQDAPQVLAYVKRWFAKRGVATRNALILNALNAAYASPKAVDHVDDLKDIINTEIPVAEALNISIVTNQSGFNFLDKLKNTITGEYVLQVDPTQATKGKLLFGKHPIMVLDNSILKTELTYTITDDVAINTSATYYTKSGNVYTKVATPKLADIATYYEVTATKAPIFIGDLKEVVRVFDREQGTIDFNAQGGSYWDYDVVGMKGRERLDVQVVDATAAVKGLITL